MKNQKWAKLSVGGVHLFVFCVLLVCNFLTSYICDDFCYLYSFADGQRIHSLVDIVKSMAAHCLTMNGRTVAHFLVQFFMLFPTIVFDVVNSLMLVAYVTLVYKVAADGEQRWNAGILAGIFCTVWLYHPGFADAILWQDGAINYLWSAVFGLLFFKEYVEIFWGRKSSPSRIKQVGFCAFSLLMGAYSENISFACILMAFCLIAWKRFDKKEKTPTYLIVGLVLACLGYCSIYLAPAQLLHKGGALSLISLMTRAVEALLMYENFGGLWIGFLALLIYNIAEKTKRDRIVLALILVLGSLAANFIMIFASYYTPRSATGAFLFLLTADVVLFYDLVACAKYRRVLATVLAIAILITIPALGEAVRDNGKTYLEVKENEAKIEADKAQGLTDLEVPALTKARTRYSVACEENMYISVEDPTDYKNVAMAKYYGVDSIIGIVIPERVLDASAYD